MPFVLPASAPRQPTTRFAPAPTGYLHLGHAASAVWVWGAARALGGRVLLRIEDHDRRRCRPEYARALLEDLEWLGLEPDLGQIGEYRSGVSTLLQSARGAIYERALLRLADAGHTYACDCSRRRISEGTEAVPSLETPYDGRCRDRGLEPGEERGVRVRMEPGPERFADFRLGEQVQEPAQQCGDLLVRDRHRQWTYQFAVTVDDWLEEVNLVVRGEDLLASTGRQLRLAHLLGRTAPMHVLHHPLIHGASGAKLSKANRDTGIRELRAAGVAPEVVLGEAAAATGLLRAPRPLRSGDLAECFRLV